MNYIVAVLHSSAIRQRHLLSSGLFHTGALVLSGETAAAETPVAGPTYRTLRAPPEIPVATAVILLRTTQEAALDWGGPFSKPGLYQTSFNKKRSEGFPAFKERYATYDLSALLNQTQLLAKDPRTNRLYFSFLNEVQFRTLQDGIKRRGEQERFGLNVGNRLYRKILQGDEVGPRLVKGDTYDPKAPVDMSSPLSGRWPSLSPPLPKGGSSVDLAKGSQRLLDYLRREGYCKDFTLSSFKLKDAGKLSFESFVEEPINLEATSTLMRSRGFPPRYDQRILQAFFADRGFDSELDDELSDAKSESDPQRMEATRSGGSNAKVSAGSAGSEGSPQDQGQVPIVLTEEKDEDQELIFCLNELLKLQVSIASSLEVACLAFRHADRDLSDNIRRAFNEANKLSAKAATVVSNYAQVAQQVSRNILPDLKLAIQEKEPNLAVSLLGIVKDWVANMKKDGEQIQHLYSALQEA
ncbi:Serine/threonine-protein kinase Chk2 [Durusdinium trenchii]|uniref:Serine/threonine-protein kinase Chk2 n=1 Tax=Durusdinium trenchii TaxID=1381693 RepID=A0ABP0P9A8_9DINO